MSRRRNLWSGLAAVGIAVALVAGVHYAPGHAPAGSLSVSAAPTVTDQLQDAGLVDGSAINTAAVRKLHAATARGYDRDSFGHPRVPWAPARARRDCSPPASTPTAACRRCTCSRGRTTPSQQPTAPPGCNLCLRVSLNLDRTLFSAADDVLARTAAHGVHTVVWFERESWPEVAPTCWNAGGSCWTPPR